MGFNSFGDILEIIADSEEQVVQVDKRVIVLLFLT